MHSAYIHLEGRHYQKLQAAPEKDQRYLKAEGKHKYDILKNISRNA